MNTTVRMLKWLLKTAVFFGLFAFALNNQHQTTLHFAFGHQWHAPMALVVLAAFALGLGLGIIGMLPNWWSQRHLPNPPPVNHAPEQRHGV